ncbi:cell division protein FtsZ [Candidatus Falkowbacteria bacterium CG_4_10_14_0_2_um_filter_41_15]|uniref:Cell division protein FtsZ n=2 Tax=Candidatus Falkowiibacteriota TaxID=1752728 RepID=A0A2M7RXZ0_9BACT|nr:MAG: cell division protein FtsZ [Candidatus Falkowbacteria bacterium CG_4_10_14_0_8_um_filter_41_36]PJA09946.1 MAG: cell division protein FtsZ [Candidatus Falkowbacteria bacterium CG_4_10_14_0_2_um_filter_41_15]
MPEVKPIAETFAKIKVVGIGGAGGNAVNRMVEEGIQGVEFIAINTDVQALHNNKADIKLHIGKTVTRGLGAGMNPELGRQAAEESQSEIRDLLKGSDMVFITCGLGGGTGTGAAPLIAEIAKDLGALTIAVVTKPFAFEGGQRRRIADRGYDDLSSQVDTIITVANEKLLTIIDKRTSLLDSFKIADNILRQGVQGIAEIITVPGIVNADFNDVRAIMANTGSALMGIGQATGENKAEEAVRAAVNSNLLETSINGAKGIVFTITGGPDLSMMEVSEAARIISSLADEDAKIIFGAVIDERLKDELKVTIVATGFNDQDRPANDFSPVETPAQSYIPHNFAKKEEDRKRTEVKEETKEAKNTSLNFSWFEKKEKAEAKVEPVQSAVKPQIKKTDDEEDEELSVPAFIRKKMM